MFCLDIGQYENLKIQNFVMISNPKDNNISSEYIFPCTYFNADVYPFQTIKSLQYKVPFLRIWYIYLSLSYINRFTNKLKYICSINIRYLGDIIYVTLPTVICGRYLFNSMLRHNIFLTLSRRAPRRCPIGLKFSP